MKAQGNMMKGKTNGRVSNQQAAFELKKRVVLALNKLADRDTYRIGVEELGRIVECLTPDGVSPFLSCILDTDSEQKSAVRKECVLLMGSLAAFHENLIGPYLGKMVAGIVKRLKDSDSVVRDACIETMGILASKLSGNSTDADGGFVVLVRPLFEALGEQNKHVQSGSALCLSRVIDNIHDPPTLVLQKMLTRTVKLLKNAHFMAKPAVIELNRSIILAGGAPTRGSLTAALTSIQEALKNSDWATRKAACSALGEIASCGAACLSSFRNSCIHCLESCRFDKVKPVRDIALQALQLWRSLPGTDTPEPSEAGSSVKEISYRDDYGDVTSASDATVKGDMNMKSCNGLVGTRIPHSSRKTGRNFSEKSQQSEANDWQIQIAVPKIKNILAAENQDDESESSSITKRCERINPDTRTIKDIGCNYVEVDEKGECSSGSNLFSDSIKSKAVMTHTDGFDDDNPMRSTGNSRRLGDYEDNTEEQRFMTKRHDRRSLDSTVTESTSQTQRGCCSETEKDLMSIKKQLMELENKQSNLVDMLKTLTSTILDSMSMVQLKVSNLEVVVDKMALELVHGGSYSDKLSNKYPKRSPSIASPRLSTCSPRPSVDSNKQAPLLPTKHAGVWDDKVFTRGRSSNFGKLNSDMWTDATLKLTKSPLGKATCTSFAPQVRGGQMPKTRTVFDSVPHTKIRSNKLGMTNNQRKIMSNYLFDGDMDSAYSEALCSGDELLLFELLDTTGPVLEDLSQKTACDLLSTLASYLLERRFVNSIIPWLQQLLDLSKIHGPAYLVLSAKAKQDFLSAVQEAAKSDAFSPSERKFLIELGKSLHQIWG